MDQGLLDELASTVGWQRLLIDPDRLVAYGYDATMG